MRYLLNFKKFSKLIYNGHLDTTLIIEESLRRNNVPFEFSKGFNPKPLFSFSNPIPFGYINRNFLLTVDTLDSFDFSSFNDFTPKGLKLTYSRRVNDNFKLSKSIEGFDFKVYLSENLFDIFKNTNKIIKGKSEYNKKIIFKNLKLKRNYKNIYMLKYYQPYDMIFNIYKIFRDVEPEKFIFYPICDEIHWR
ncbi:MAG: TIGR03936 family radical SAM-associated protein [Thermotogota bacterium]